MWSTASRRILEPPLHVGVPVFCPTTEANRGILVPLSRVHERRGLQRPRPVSRPRRPGDPEQPDLCRSGARRDGTAGERDLEPAPLLLGYHVSYEGGRSLNSSHQKARQRCFHCGGAEKFSEEGPPGPGPRGEPVAVDELRLVALLSRFGGVRTGPSNREVPPRRVSPRLPRPRLNSSGRSARSRRGWASTRRFPLGSSALIDGMRGCMCFRGSMEDYIDLVRTLPGGAKVVEVGSCEGRSIVSLALACLDRDYTFYSVESFAGDQDGTLDGGELPSIERYVATCGRFAFLRINPVFGRSGDACALGFADGSLDAVFIDAAHDETSVRQRHPPLVCASFKPGGLLFGDDWGWGSVRRGSIRCLIPSESAPRRAGISGSWRGEPPRGPARGPMKMAGLAPRSRSQIEGPNRWRYNATLIMTMPMTIAFSVPSSMARYSRPRPRPPRRSSSTGPSPRSARAARAGGRPGWTGTSGVELDVVRLDLVAVLVVVAGFVLLLAVLVVAVLVSDPIRRAAPAPRVKGRCRHPGLWLVLLVVLEVVHDGSDPVEQLRLPGAGPFPGRRIAADARAGFGPAGAGSR